MKHWYLTFCLVIASLFGSVGEGFAYSDRNACYKNSSTCDQKNLCFYARSGNQWEIEKQYQKHVREAKRRGYTCGIVKRSLLKINFYKLSKERRRHLQSNLKDLGLYKSSIDGLYGKETYGALKAYNKEHLDGADLKLSNNVSALIEAVLASVGSGFASDLPPCPSSGYKHNCFGSYTFANGNKYVGEYKDGKRNGQGTYTLASGGKYVGEYKDDKKNGQGTFTWADGDKYVGEYKDGKRHGQGTCTYADGTVEEGIWKDGEFQYAQKLSPPVPVIKAPTQDDEIISASSGSGFAVSSDGHVITNHHVIEGCQKVVVHTKEKDLTVRVITYDPQNDLALLKGDFRPQTVFPLSNSRPELLQDIYVAGYPFGNEISTSVKVTKGIISSLTGIANNFSNIQIDAALQSGNSGGPILDDLGNVVGVAVAKLDAKYMFDNFGSIPENTNFGIKSIIVRSILDSNEVDSLPANQLEISKSKLGKMISSGTYYISCWMTMAQIEKMQSEKMMFSNLK